MAKTDVAENMGPTPAGQELLDRLNDEQRRAVTHGEGPLLIIAGAGTGKTMVIAHRIARLISTGRVEPEEILALTFTDKAAGEMVTRVEDLLPLGYVELWISTFHSFCQRVLQEHGLEIGLPDDFRLLNQTDAYLLVRRNFDRFELDHYRPLGNPTKFIHAMLAHFSRAKDEAVSPKEYLEYAKGLSLDRDDASQDAESPSRSMELAGAYHTYQRLLLDNSALDLGDLQTYTIELFKKRPDILERYRRRFRQVVVDEFQDTNWAQYELLKMLVGPEGNIMVVGDDDQSIYKFRGASVANILQFKEDFPSSSEVVLTKNYRSRQDILDLAYRFIQANNPNRLEVRLSEGAGRGISKRLESQCEGPGLIEHLHFAAGADEAAGAVDRIVSLKEVSPERSWSDFCILVRSNSSADEFSAELARRGIPFQFLALRGLYTKPIILDCLAYLHLLDDYHEGPAVYRTLVSPPFSLPAADLATLTHEANRRCLSLFEVMRQHRANLEFSDEGRAVMDRLLSLVERHTQLARRSGVSELFISYIYDSGYINAFKDGDTVETRQQLSLIRQFHDRLKRFEAGHDDPTLRHFMEEFSFERESGEQGGLTFDVEEGPDMVRIMTVHAAKGLEFPHVMIAHLVDKRFPVVRRGAGIELPEELTKEVVPEGDIHLEEERRLFYVAMTRAKEGLHLLSADDYGGRTKKKLSRFLHELGFEKPEKPRRSQTLQTDRRRSVAAVTDDRGDGRTTPAHFSFTQLAAHERCPLQYKFAHVARIPVYGKAQMSFGKTIHGVLERFMREWVTRSSVCQADLFGSAGEAGGGVPVSKEELFEMYEAGWQDDWFPDKRLKEEYRAKGRSILSSFHDRVVRNGPANLYVEKDFRLKLGDFWIRGKIDRIDRLDDGVEIIDYKTGAAKGDGKLRSDDKKQLLLYQIAVESLFDLKPRRLTYHYLENGVDASFLGTDREKEALKQELLDRMERVRQGDFSPRPGRHCGFCDFRSICEFNAN